jgi:molybdopterin molybdotransferase
MLSVADAQRLVLEHVLPLPPQTVALGPSLLGRVLAEDVVSDTDSPPHDKALMDGYAVRCADLTAGRAALRVIEEISAGSVPRHAVGPGQAVRIMTGAPLPPGAEAVVMVERTRLLPDGRVEIEDRPPKPGQHVLPRGREMRAGETVLRAGLVLRPQEVGLLAVLGRDAVRVVWAPRVAVLPTGDELVDVGQVPGPGQIRNSNGPMLLAQAARSGAVAPTLLGIARDRLDSLRPLVEEGLSADVLVLSGGVSAGKFDLVPGVLQEAGVRAQVHKVALKPGKPLFFGTRDRPGGGRTLVFGLPGNPVSSLVCFELFVRPALRKLAGYHTAPPGADAPGSPCATLSEDFAYRTDRPTYHPAWLEASPRGWRVRPVPWFGSADLRALAQANALVVFPPGDHTHRAGEVFSVIPMDG